MMPTCLPEARKALAALGQVGLSGASEVLSTCAGFAYQKEQAV